MCDCVVVYWWSESLQCSAQAMSWVQISLRPLVFLLKVVHLKVAGKQKLRVFYAIAIIGDVASGSR